MYIYRHLYVDVCIGMFPLILTVRSREYSTPIKIMPIKDC